MDGLDTIRKIFDAIIGFASLGTGGWIAAAVAVVALGGGYLWLKSWLKKRANEAAKKEREKERREQQRKIDEKNADLEQQQRDNQKRLDDAMRKFKEKRK